MEGTTQEKQETIYCRVSTHTCTYTVSSAIHSSEKFTPGITDTRSNMVCVGFTLTDSYTSKILVSLL